MDVCKSLFRQDPCSTAAGLNKSGLLFRVVGCIASTFWELLHAWLSSSKAVQVQPCQMHGCAGAWLCSGCAGAVQGHGCAWQWLCMAVQVHGSGCAWLCRCMAVAVHGRCMAVQWPCRGMAVHGSGCAWLCRCMAVQWPCRGMAMQEHAFAGATLSSRPYINSVPCIRWTE